MTPRSANLPTPPKPPFVPESRQTLIARFSEYLDDQHYPRLGLLTILSASGLIGFCSSAALLLLGLHSMPVRYGLAAVAAYVCFLGMVRLWARRYDHIRPKDPTFPDLLDPSLLPDRTMPEAFSFGHGGAFSGGGAGRSIGEAATSTADHSAGVLDIVPDLDEGFAWLLPIILVITIVVGLVSAVILLATAPALFGEVLLDAGIAGLVYRRVHRFQPQYWMKGVLRRTWKPMFAVGATLIAAAALAQHIIPTADSIGDFFRR